ncbi:HlyC/CorC family transporter [Candidatus Dependentiae bacterium]|nr:HlyC/CorC family transporter [Candidatus Dependentiae bacterium]
MSTVYIFIVGAVVCYFLSGLVSFLETAIHLVRPYQLKALRDDVKSYERLFDIWQTNPQKLLIGILLLNSFIDIVATLCVSKAFEIILGSIGIGVGAVVATVANILFTNLIPKMSARLHYLKGVKMLLWFASGIITTLYPIVTVLLSVVNNIFLFFGNDITSSNDAFTEDELEYLIKQSDESGIIDSEKSEMLQNVFGLGEIFVEKVMVPKSDMVLLDVNAGIPDAIQFLRHHRYSRVPVYDGKEDNIIGIIYHKDLFDHYSSQVNITLKEIVRPVLFTPQTKRVSQLLNEFLKKRMHMAIVIDEFGNVIGLVTLEDLIEEIVGEISDEHEKIHTGIIPLEQGGWLINASIMLDKLEDFLAIKFEVEESLTLAGFLAEKFEYLPQNGESLIYRGYIFTVQQATDKRIFQVLIVHEKTTVISGQDVS